MPSSQGPVQVHSDKPARKMEVGSIYDIPSARCSAEFQRGFLILFPRT